MTLETAKQSAVERKLEQLPPTVSQLFEQAVHECGDRQLWTFIETGETISYADAWKAIARTANAMTEIGVKKGTHVAVRLGNKPQFYYLWLALARLGAVLVPINTRYTADELKFVLEDSDATFLFTDHEGMALALTLVDTLPSALAKNIRIWASDGRDGDFAKVVEKASSEMPEDMAATSDLLNIQYTSGTTGFPKGCMLSHEYWVFGASVPVLIWPEEPTKFLADSAFFYIDPQWELLATIYARAELFVAPKPSLTNFIPILRDYKIDYASFWEAMAFHPQRPDDGDHSLRHAWVFGLNPKEHKRLETRFRINAREMYAMTETGCVLYVRWDDHAMTGSGTCGQPSPSREVRIVDPESGSDVPAGQSGELWVRGKGLFSGYYNRPQANAECLLPDGWFRTGDLFFRNADGYYFYTGRLKDMIRRSSENIAAREVEAVLERIPGISALAVIGIPDEFCGEEVKACIVLDDPDNPLHPRAIIDAASASLAPFKLPRFIQFMDSLPMTPSGRVEKKRLREAKANLRSGSFDIKEDRWIT